MRLRVRYDGDTVEGVQRFHGLTMNVDFIMTMSSLPSWHVEMEGE
jgi:hypothetical protein